MMNYFEPIPLLTAQDMGATFSSTPVRVMLQDNVGLWVIWTGTPTGTFTVEASMDYKTNPSDPADVLVAGNWTSLNAGFNPAITQPAGAAGGLLLNLNQIPFPYVRVTYTYGSGAGSCSAMICAKGV